MSFIPSFILSALIFCKTTIPGGWDEASFQEGIICEFPYTAVTVSAEEKADEPPSLKNAAAILKLDALSLKLAAGSLSITGTGGTGTLSAALPGKDDGSKPLSFFASWKWFSLYAADNRMLMQLTTTFSKAHLSNALTAGWTRISPTKDDSWFLRYPWHPGGNLHSLSDTLSLSFQFARATLETEGTAALSLPDMLSPAAGFELEMCLKSNGQEHAAETAISISAHPHSFMLADGSFTPDTLNAGASFSLSSETTAFTAEAGFVHKQPAKAKELSKRLVSASLAYALEKESFAMDMSVGADKFSPDEGLKDTELSPQLDLMLSGTELTLKGTFLPFKDQTDDTYSLPEWSVKAERTQKELTVFYKAEFTGTSLETQVFSAAFDRQSLKLGTQVSVKKTGLSWELTFSRRW